MKKYYNKLMMALVISMGLVTLSSCKKYLDTPLPTNSLATESAFTSKGAIDGMMNNMYISFIDNSVYPNNIRLTECVADNAYNPTATYLTDYQVSNITTNLAQGPILTWGSAYRSIYLANVMLEGLPGATAAGFTDEMKKQYVAAAKTVRAYSYFQLVRVYGDVPLITSTKADEEKSKGRTPKAEVYKQIEKDLTEAISDLPATLGVKYFINNKFIPEAILANVYLTEGKWAEAEAAATDIISSNKFQMATNVNDVFLQTSPETISALGYTTLQSATNSPKTSVAAYLVLPQGGNLLFFESTFPSLSTDLLNGFEPGDLRKTNWIMFTNAGGYSNPNNRMFSYKYKYNPSFYTGTIPAGREEDLKFIRLAEIYLIRAEARAQQNNLVGAAGDLNMIRNRAGLANTTAGTQPNILDAILKERRVELFYENGTRWFDLVRTGKANAVLGAIPYKTANWKPYMVLFPIYPADLSANPNLTQTPGY